MQEEWSPSPMYVCMSVQLQQPEQALAMLASQPAAARVDHLPVNHAVQTVSTPCLPACTPDACTPLFTCNHMPPHKECYPVLLDATASCCKGNGDAGDPRYQGGFKGTCTGCQRYDPSRSEGCCSPAAAAAGQSHSVTAM